jgi:hypothetical protein
MKSGANCPALWLMTMQIFSERGLGTACIGEACIPGKSFRLKEPENLPFERSWSHWVHKKFFSFASRGIPSDSSTTDG